MNYEIISLIKWVLKGKNNFIKLNNLARSGMSRKLIQKFRNHYSVNNYPVELQKILNKTINGIATKNNFPIKINSTDHPPPHTIAHIYCKIRHYFRFEANC
jgi:hypothetical protein